LQECFGTLLNPKKSLVNDFEHKFNLSCEIAGMGEARVRQSLKKTAAPLKIRNSKHEIRNKFE
jgi:hypothetical protein